MIKKPKCGGVNHEFINIWWNYDMFIDRHDSESSYFQYQCIHCGQKFYKHLTKLEAALYRYMRMIFGI